MDLGLRGAGRFPWLERRRTAAECSYRHTLQLWLHARADRARPMGSDPGRAEHPRRRDHRQLRGDGANVGVDARLADAANRLQVGMLGICTHIRGTATDAPCCPNGERIPVPPEHVFNAAKAAGLDFIALTDHNTASHWSDVDSLQSLYPDLLLLHGSEVTTYRGHMNAFGGTALVDFRLAPGRSIGAIATELVSDGAFVSINHPERPDDETCMGCGWNDRDDDTIRRLQGVEIVNGDLAEGKMSGWPFWATLLNRGHRLSAIGGSDEHTPDETLDQRIGRPTTVVRARELSEPALIEGIRAGRVYIRTRGPDGPTLELSATSGARHYELGDEVPAGALTLEAIVGRAAGQTATWIRNGEAIVTRPIPADGRLSHQVAARAGDWFSLILRDASGPTLYSGAGLRRAVARPQEHRTLQRRDLIAPRISEERHLWTMPHVTE